MDLSRLFTRLCSVQRIEIAEEVFDSPKAFFETINAEVYRNLNEAIDALLALHCLDAPTRFTVRW